MAPLLTLLLPLAGKIFDKVLPDETAREAAKLELLAMQGSQEMDLLQVQMSAIVAEAKSQDPWTSRARPAFLYVVYLYILFGIPMGVLFTFNPEAATALSGGARAWLTSIPEEMWWLFGTGYLGYVGARTVDKGREAARSSKAGL